MKALVGSWDNRPYRLLAENAALRARVVDLEAALRDVQEENAVLRAAAVEAPVALEVEVAEVALSAR
jgi:hypothetical protein